MTLLTQYKRLWSFCDHDLLLLNRAEQLGEEGIEKRLKELGDTAKEIDELRKMREIIRDGNAFKEISISELKRQKLKQLEDYRLVIERLEREEKEAGK